jgi:hypothetical protein
MGRHGGIDFEGVWEDDGYEPKRFFSLYQDADLQQVVSEFFTISSFDPIIVDRTNTELHFQSVILQKKRIMRFKATQLHMHLAVLRARGSDSFFKHLAVIQTRFDVNPPAWDALGERSGSLVKNAKEPQKWG